MDILAIEIAATMALLVGHLAVVVRNRIVQSRDDARAAAN
jgi:hypothetical protein